MSKLLLRRRSACRTANHLESLGLNKFQRRLAGSLHASAWIALGTLLAIGMISIAMPASAQSLVLRSQGSFFVGGNTENVGPDADITINQMYVQYQIPAGFGFPPTFANNIPVVLIHGCCLSSKSWEETPDGRMGWNTYFVLKGHPTYLVDQVSRARSGFDATVFNKVQSGALPPSSQPVILQQSHQTAWPEFRFGPTYGQTFAGLQFPISSVDEFYKQMIPDLNSMLSPTANPTFANLASLAQQLQGAVLIGHSESGFFPELAALVSTKDIKGIVTIETGCPLSLPPLTDAQIVTLHTIPQLFLYGDYVAQSPSWNSLMQSCQTYANRIKSAGGDVTFIQLPNIGIHGNSHMMMLDKNNLQVADVILDWIQRHVKH